MSPESTQKLVRFGFAGAAATLCYAFAAYLLEAQFSFAPTMAAALAYAIATSFSYLTQRSFTFRSDVAHETALPRFLLLSAFGALLAIGSAQIFGVMLGWRSIAQIGVTCALVPVINFLVMERLIFRTRAASEQT